MDKFVTKNATGMRNAYMEEAARWMLRAEDDAKWCGLYRRPVGRYYGRCIRLAQYNIRKADALVLAD